MVYCPQRYLKNIYWNNVVKIHKSKIFRLPGYIRWEASMPSGTSVDVFVLYSSDGKDWSKRSGPHKNKDGSRLDFQELTKLKLEIKVNPNGADSPQVLKVWIYRYDAIIEFGGEAGWD